MSTTTPPELEGFGQYKFGWHDPAHYVFTPEKGLNADVVREISFLKSEPEWMTKFRLRALEIFERKPMPTWGADLGDIDFQDIYYFIRAVRAPGPELGRGSAGHQEHVRPARHSRGRAEVPVRGIGPVRERGRLPLDP